MNASLLAALRTATDLARARKPEEATRIIRQALGGHRHMPLPEVPAVQPAPSLGRGLAETLRTLRARRHPPWQARPVVAVPDGAVFLSRTVSITAGTRDYRLYLPSNLTAAPRPLVVMLHGCTQTPEDFAVGTGMNALAERHGFLVAYPEQSREANQTGCWNWFASEHQCRWTGEPAIIAAIVAAIADEQAVDRTRVFVAGMSAGGAMAAILAATHPDLFAGISIHSGLPFGAAHDMPSALAAMRGEPTNSLTRPPLVRATKGQPRLIVFHGDADVTVSPANSDAIVEAARATLGRSSDEVVRGAAAGGRSFTRTITHDANGRAVLEHWVVHGGGHAWAGGHAAGSFTDPAGPDASAEIIRFFLNSSHAEGTLSCN
jgi:poly(hydroxyalkanoate) depolymerase family esterase